MPEILGSEAAAGEGTGSRIFRTGSEKTKRLTQRNRGTEKKKEVLRSSVCFSMLKRQERGSGGGRSSVQIIHPIAIGKRLPGQDGDDPGGGPARAPTKP
jgi:hypothetical protein